MNQDQQYIRERSEAEPMGGCWIWTAALMPNGYGVAWRCGSARPRGEDTPEELNEERITNLVRALDECKALLVESQATVERLNAELADALGEDP